MAVKLTDESKTGELFVAHTGEVHQIKSFCFEPTVTMEQMSTGEQTLGAVGCTNLDGFTPLKDLNNHRLIASLKVMTEKCRQGRIKRIRLTEEVAALKEQLAELKLKVAGYD